VTDFYDDEHDDLDAASPYTEFVSEQLMLRLRDIVQDAPKVPLSASAMVSREELLELIDEAVDRLPDELRAARWLLKERDEFLTKVRHEGEEIINQARARAEQLVQRTEVIKAAEQRAYEIVDAAETDSRRLRHEVEDFCDQKLASFEIVLDRTMALVATGRAKLQGTNLTAGIPVDDEGGDGVYDDAAQGDGYADNDGNGHDGNGYDDGGYGGDASYDHLPPPPGGGAGSR
jgi:vacuolar-type H+-ATPase subunit H